MMSWKKIIASQNNETYFKELNSNLESIYEDSIVYPPKEDLYRAFTLCEYLDTKLVIIGQDPYHGKGQANGLAFSVYKDTKIPPSLRNIYKELEDDLGVVKVDGELEGWAKQGVLLLNKILSVEEASPASHKDLGWDEFTNFIIKSFDKHPDKVIFLLWGNHARKLKPLIASKHIIIEGVHPSPLAAYRGFFGSKPFSKINEHLIALHKEPIDWSK